jgi:hypothetical protein
LTGINKEEGLLASFYPSRFAIALRTYYESLFIKVLGYDAAGSIPAASTRIIIVFSIFAGDRVFSLILGPKGFGASGFCLTAPLLFPPYQGGTGFFITIQIAVISIDIISARYKLLL